MMRPFPLLFRALDALDEPVSWFFRDDDAGWADVQLLDLCDVFVDRAPLDLAVIPMAMCGRVAEALVVHPASIGFHQHGYAHRNHETVGRKCEFSDDRSADQIAEEIAAGSERLGNYFVDRLDRVFAPPWNRCGDKTAAALAALGLPVLSRDRGAAPLDGVGLFELSVSVDWVRYRLNIDETLAAAVSRPPVGVMLHHEVFDDFDMVAIDQLLDVLVRHPNVRLMSMRALAPAGVA